MIPNSTDSVSNISSCFMDFNSVKITHVLIVLLCASFLLILILKFKSELEVVARNWKAVVAGNVTNSLQLSIRVPPQQEYLIRERTAQGGLY